MLKLSCSPATVLDVLPRTAQLTGPNERALNLCFDRCGLSAWPVRWRRRCGAPKLPSSDDTSARCRRTAESPMVEQGRERYLGRAVHRPVGRHHHRKCFDGCQSCGAGPTDLSFAGLPRQEGIRGRSVLVRLTPPKPGGRRIAHRMSISMLVAVPIEASGGRFRPWNTTGSFHLMFAGTTGHVDWPEMRICSALILPCRQPRPFARGNGV